jgi:23S rRNA (uracil1939-C5)-methyltransferase
MTQQIKLKRGEEIQLEITASAFEGKSIGRYAGCVVFVEGAIPGDTVVARILKSKHKHAEAKILTILKPSAQRVEPRCAHFGVCGGCKWQQVDYAAQLQFKQQHVVDSFERIGGFTNVPISPIIGAQETFFYRNKMEFSFAAQEWLDIPPKKTVNPPDDGTDGGEPMNGSVFVGLHVPQRYDKILDIKECHLQSEQSNRILAFTREFARANKKQVYDSDLDSGYLRFLVIRQSRRTNQLMINLVTRTDDSSFMVPYADEVCSKVEGVTTVVNTINSKRAQIAFGDQERVYTGNGTIHEQLGGRSFIISAGSFFQTNTAQAEHLYEAAKVLGNFSPTDTVYDLYSGTGSIALFISPYVKEVIGVESVGGAVRDAERNANANGVVNCYFVSGDLKDRLTRDTDWMQRHSKPDAIILDPPRSGIHPKAVEKLVEMGSPKIVYVSCNPATQARDVKALCASQRYALERLQPVDMFPHTYHIENVALLTRR